MVGGDVAHGAIGDGLGIAGRVGAADEPEHVGHLPGATELAEVLAGGRRLRFVRGVAIRPRSRGLSRRLPNRRTRGVRSEEHTSELQSLMRISYAVFCLKKKKKQNKTHTYNIH